MRCGCVYTFIDSARAKAISVMPAWSAKWIASDVGAEIAAITAIPALAALCTISYDACEVIARNPAPFRHAIATVSFASVPASAPISLSSAL